MLTLTRSTNDLRRAVQNGCTESRDHLARKAYETTVRGALAMTRDNGLYDPDDVRQQVWEFSYEAVDKDRGIGDAVGFYRFFVLNRLRDWMGGAVRRHAFCECTKCSHRQAIRPVRDRVCSACGASGSDIASVSIVDRAEDFTDAKSTTDDYSVIAVREFWEKLSELEQAVMVDRLNGRERVEIGYRNGITSSAVSKIVKNIGIKFKEQHG